MVDEVYAEHPLIAAYLNAEARYKAAWRLLHQAHQTRSRVARLAACVRYALANRRCLRALRRVQMGCLFDARLSDQARALGLVRR